MGTKAGVISGAFVGSLVELGRKTGVDIQDF